MGARDPSSGRTWYELARACRHPAGLLGELATRTYEDDLLTVAAALAYYFFLSLFPLMLFVLALTSVLPLHGLESWLLGNAQRSLPAEAYGPVARTVDRLLNTPRGGLLSVGAVLVLWTASAAFAALMNGLNRAHRVHDPRQWWVARLHAIGLTVGLSLFMIVAFVLAVFGGQLVDLVARHLGPAAGIAALVVRWTVAVAVVLLTVAAIYYACPAVEREWQWVRPGAVLFALGFAASSAAFSYYVSRFGSYDRTYGSLGAVIILLFWMYLLAFFLLLGGELNALLEARVEEAGRLRGEPPDEAVRERVAR